MDKEAGKRTLAVAQWRQLTAETGMDLPVCIPINGVSMMPLIRRNRDPVTIIPLRRAPQRGDVVLFHDPVGERYVLHRVWRTREGRTLTWGDNCSAPDGWMDNGEVWGLAVEMTRDGRRVRLDTSAARSWGLALGRVRHWWSRLRAFLYRIWGRLPESVKKAVRWMLKRDKKE